MRKNTVSVHEVAYFLDMTPRRIQQLVVDEVLPRVAPGRYDLQACVVSYVRYMREQVAVYSGMNTYLY